MQTLSEIDTQDKDLRELAETLNHRLGESGAERAEQAFRLGCLIGIVQSLLVLIFLLLLKVINFAQVIILAVIAGLICIGVSYYLANYARMNAIRKTYQAETEVAIHKFIANHNLSRIEFDRIVSRLLPKEAPLQNYVYPTRERVDLKE